MEVHHIRLAVKEGTDWAEVRHIRLAVEEGTVHLEDMLVVESYRNMEVLVEGLDHIARVVVLVHNLAAEQEAVPIDLVAVDRRNFPVVGDSLLVVVGILLPVVRRILVAVADSPEADSFLEVDNLLGVDPEVETDCTDQAEDRNRAAENLKECQNCKHQQGMRSNSRLRGGPGC